LAISPEAPPLAGMTVLLVEDEFLIAAEAQRIMEDAGAASVHVANSMARAREIAAGLPTIDLGVVDLRLDGETAMPLVEELHRRGVPLLIATGFDPGVDLPGTVLVHKPYRDVEMLSGIAQVLGVRRCPPEPAAEDMPRP
jgi:DNA-binding response OmpR family regulator